MKTTQLIVGRNLVTFGDNDDGTFSLWIGGADQRLTHVPMDDDQRRAIVRLLSSVDDADAATAPLAKD